MYLEKHKKCEIETTERREKGQERNMKDTRPERKREKMGHMRSEKQDGTGQIRDKEENIF